MKVHVRRNDTVIVISGKDKGKADEVLRVIPKTGRVVVKRVNLVKKHQKSSRQDMQGGIIEMEAAVDSSEVMLFCEKCRKATKISHKSLEDGAKVRVCKKYGETLQNLKGGTLRR